MKKILAIFLSSILALALTSSQKIENKKNSAMFRVMAGYLVDQMCGKRMVMDDSKKSDAKASRHTKECALDENCKANGYGLVSGGRFYKFDTAGDKKAEEFLRSTKKETDIKVSVAGVWEGENINVESIKDFKSARQIHKTKK
jgi:hypothetical protein